MNRSVFLPRLLAAAALLLCAALAHAQALPTRVAVAGNVATVEIGPASAPVADMTLTFDDASGLTPANLGVSAQWVNPLDPALLARLTDGALNVVEGSFPLLVTIEPPAGTAFAFRRTVRVEVHTHALPYTVGSPLRLFKAPLGGMFRDITDEIAPGSVRARGTTGGFSQFLVLTDLRPTTTAIGQKFDALDAHLATLPAAERDALAPLASSARAAVAAGRYAAALSTLDEFRSRVLARAGVGIPDTWRPGVGGNTAGELLAGAATLKFSIAYLRDFGD
ncbi:DUF6689 family protein [Vulcaniibacterium thermophilum]|uniref:Uncharacterized protein n=1 Tax=Vulcaniibacterium thermophilum TaxID=1169913 RepID=A0A918YVZ4_9GAMM|nr:DUF6689 family protein [Vulcaniibacterium thermophilum]GHE25542.1 hypothetical protein GCM10007167_02640 [Vulcaniibacterium thermophilum]